MEVKYVVSLLVFLANAMMFRRAVGVLRLPRVNLGTLAVALFLLVLNKWIWHD